MTFGIGKDLIQTQNEDLNENMINSAALIFRISVVNKIHHKQNEKGTASLCHTHLTLKSYPLCI